MSLHLSLMYVNIVVCTIVLALWYNQVGPIYMYNKCVIPTDKRETVHSITDTRTTCTLTRTYMYKMFAGLILHRGNGGDCLNAPWPWAQFHRAALKQKSLLSKIRLRAKTPLNCYAK